MLSYIIKRLVAKTTSCTLTILLVFLTFMVKAQMPQAIHNKLLWPTETHNLKFIWKGDSVNNDFEKYSGMLIPVKIKNCPKVFYMQFDLGSPYSLFYKKKLEAIKVKCPDAKINVLAPKNAAVDFKLGDAQVKATDINLRDFGSVEIIWKSNDPKIIGTIGVDIFDGKTLVINYPERKLMITETLPEKLNKENITYAPFTYAQRSVLLPATIQGKKTMLFFDTGSSRYTLLTDEKTAKSMAANNARPVVSQVSSWDKILTANSFATSATIAIGGETIALTNVTYMQGASSAQIDMMTKIGIGGMTGNKLFLPYKLVLDTKNKRFALVK